MGIANNPFSAPIPGQSLTTPPGSHAWEQPPQYVHDDEALVHVLDKMTQPSAAKTIAAALDKGMYASDITNGILVKGTMDGLWNPDLAAVMARRVFAGVVAVGSAQGVKSINYRRPDNQYKQTIGNLAKLPEMRQQEAEAPKEQPVQIQGVMGNTPTEGVVN